MDIFKGLFVVFTTIGCATAYGFFPQTVELNLTELAALPLVFNFSESNSHFPNATNSWWSCSFVTCSDEHQYMVLSHLVELSETQTIYRSSIQDVTNTSYHRHFIELVEDPDVFSGSQDGAFNVSADGFYFGSTTSDNSISQLRTVSTSPDVSFDLTFDLSASILFNGGLGGLFQWGGSQTAEWAMTSGYTSGSIIRDGQSIEFDPERSFTWYDRQWLYGDASALNWTWFQLHTDSSRDGPGEKYSIWIYGGDVDQHQFATFHSSKRVDTVLAVKSFEPFGEPWQSSVTNNTYEQHWKLILQDDTMLTIDSIHGDQEIFSGTAGAYEGFVEFHGFDSLNRTIEGFGLVEITPV